MSAMLLQHRAQQRPRRQLRACLPALAGRSLCCGLRPPEECTAAVGQPDGGCCLVSEGWRCHYWVRVQRAVPVGSCPMAGDYRVGHVGHMGLGGGPCGMCWAGGAILYACSQCPPAGKPPSCKPVAALRMASALQPSDGACPAVLPIARLHAASPSACLSSGLQGLYLSFVTNLHDQTDCCWRRPCS
jgi:hypothetical protein